MSRLLVILWAAGLLAQQNEGQQNEVKNPRTSAEDIALGAKTFRSHCSPCHGLKAEGGRGPNLSNGVFYHGSTDSELLANVSNGIPGTEMPGLFYSPDRVWQVIAYIRSLQADLPRTTAADAAAGKAVFQRAGCPGCHRVDGVGGRLGPDLSEVGKARSRDYIRQSVTDPNAYVAPRYWVVSLVDSGGRKYQGFLMNEDTYTVQFIDMSENLHSLPKAETRSYKVEKISHMPSYKGKLSDADIDQVVGYLSSLRPTGGAQ